MSAERRCDGDVAVAKRASSSVMISLISRAHTYTAPKYCLPLDMNSPGPHIFLGVSHFTIGCPVVPCVRASNCISGLLPVCTVLSTGESPDIQSISVMILMMLEGAKRKVVIARTRVACQKR